MNCRYYKLENALKVSEARKWVNATRCSTEMGLKDENALERVLDWLRTDYMEGTRRRTSIFYETSVRFIFATREANERNGLVT